MPTDPRQLDHDQLQAQTRSLRALARAMVGDEHRAEDLVQDAYVTALQRPAKPGWALGRWLSGITRNHARQDVRETRRRARREEVAAIPETQPMDESIERIDLLRHMLDRVRGLDEPYRGTVLLRYFDGVSTQEIAQRQGVPPATVRTRLHRAIDILRRQMDEHSGGDRRAWMLPLLPFVSVPDPVSTAASVELLSHGVRDGVLSVTAKKVLALSSVVLVGFAVPLVMWWNPPTGTSDPQVQLRRESTVADAASPARTAAAEGDPLAAGQRRKSLPAPNSSGKAEPKPGRPLRLFGVVCDAQGEPIADATVWADKTSATTAADGSYSLAVSWWLLRGFGAKGGLQARAPGYTCAVDRLIGALGAAEKERSEVRVDFQLHGALVVDGRVTDTAGRGIAGAVVRGYHPGARPTKTDAEGHFQLDHLDPAVPRHYLQASARDYVYAARTVETAGQTEIRGVGFVLGRGAVVRGVVYGRQHQPVAGAWIQVAQGKGGVETKTDGQGRFELPAVASGTRQVLVQHRDYAVYSRAITVPAGGQEIEVVIELLVGESITGRVSDAQGVPIEGAVATSDTGAKGGKGGFAKTDADGGFVLQHLPRGDREVRVRAEGYLPQRLVVPAGSRGLVFQLRQGAQIAGRVLDAETGAPVEAFTVRFIAPSVAAAEGGKGGKRDNRFAGVRRVVNVEGIWDTGDQALPDGYVTGVEIRADGYAPGVIPRAVARSMAHPDDHRLRLAPGCSLRGRVLVDSTSQPVAGAAVKVVRPSQPLDLQSYGKTGLVMLRTDATGQFEFRHVAAGALFLAVEHPQWGVSLHALRVEASARDRRHDLRLKPQASLTGVVRDRGGNALPAARIVLSAVEVPGVRGRLGEVRADPSGRYVFRRIPAGVYRLARRRDGAKGMEVAARYVQISGSGQHELDLSFPGQGRLRGTLSVTGDLPPWTMLRLQPIEPEGLPWAQRRTPRQSWTVTASFELDGLATGRYRLVASHEGKSGVWRGEVEVDIQAQGETAASIRLEPQR